MLIRNRDPGRLPRATALEIGAKLGARCVLRRRIAGVQPPGTSNAAALTRTALEVVCSATLAWRLGHEHTLGGEEAAVSRVDSLYSLHERKGHFPWEPSLPKLSDPCARALLAYNTIQSYPVLTKWFTEPQKTTYHPGYACHPGYASMLQLSLC